METRKFKTSAKCAGCVSAIAAKLDGVMTPDEWSVDLSDPNRVMTVRSEADDSRIMAAVQAAGFKIEKL